MVFKIISFILALVLSFQSPALAQTNTPAQTGTLSECQGPMLRVATGQAPGIVEDLGGVWRGVETLLYDFIALQNGFCGTEITNVKGIENRLEQVGRSGDYDVGGGMITPLLRRANEHDVKFLVYDMSGSAVVSKRGFINPVRMFRNLLRLETWVRFLGGIWLPVSLFLIAVTAIRTFEFDMLMEKKQELAQKGKDRRLISLAMQLWIESATTKGFGWLAPQTLLGSGLCTSAFVFLVAFGVPNISQLLETPYVSVPQELWRQDVVVIEGSSQEQQARQYRAKIHTAKSIAELREKFNDEQIDAALIDSPLVKGLKFGPTVFEKQNFFGDSAGVGLALPKGSEIDEGQLWLEFLAANEGELAQRFYQELNG